MGGLERDERNLTLRSLERIAERADGDDKLQRDFNRAWFEGLDVDVDDDQRTEVVAVRRNDVTEALAARREGSLTAALAENYKRRQDRGPDGGGCTERVDVSNFSLLVELRGFEPLASSMRTRRATNCATAPGNRLKP